MVSVVNTTDNGIKNSKLQRNQRISAKAAWPPIGQDILINDWFSGKFRI